MQSAITNTHATRFVDLPRCQIQLTVGGSGQPLLYLHGAGGETDWMPFHAKLAERHEVYLPAHPGFALSTGLEEIRDIADLAWYVIDLLAALKLNQLPVVGFSLGGWLALEVALLRPQLFSRIVLVNSAGIRLPEHPLPELFQDDFDAMRRLLFVNPDSEVVAQAMPLSIHDARILAWLRAREATARVAWNPYLHRPRLKDHLHRIESPTLVIWGRHDRLIPLPYGEYFAAHIPHAQLKVFDDCGHMLNFEQPARFAEAVHGFLS